MTEAITAAEFRSRKRAWQRKYRNKPVVVDGVRHDSKREAARWAELQRLEQLGAIAGLERQVVYVLHPSVAIEGENRARPALRYIADFVYHNGERLVVEDIKSPATAKLAAFRQKQHMMKSVHGLDVTVMR